MSFIHAFILKCSLHIINTTHRCVLYSLWPWILTRRNPCHQQFIERNSSWECSHRKYWIKIPFVTVKYLNICNNKSIWAGYQGSAARWGAGTRWTVRTGASNTISIIYCPWSNDEVFNQLLGRTYPPCSPFSYLSYFGVPYFIMNIPLTLKVICKIYHTVNRLRSFLSSCHPDIWSFGHLIIQSFGHSVIW